MADSSERIRKPSAVQRIRRRVAEIDPAQGQIFEKRLLAGASGLLIVALGMWSLAVGTDYWFHVQPEQPMYMNRSGLFFVRSHSGLWTICKTITRPPSTQEEMTCHNHRLFPSDEFIEGNPEVDSTILDYTRTETAFAIITFCLIGMGFGFSIYTFREPRYTFKRLAGAVHFIGAASSLVVIEVMINSVEYEEQYLPARHPKGASWSYGFSCGLAWVCFALLLVSGTIFLACSRKKKRGGTDDGPNIIGRA